MRAVLVVAYLAAIVAANLSIEHWGPQAAVWNAFLFIGLDLTTRDRLHDLWRGRVLRNMAVLIAAGSALSYLLNNDTGRIALASAAAFAAAAFADGVVYHLLRHRDWFERANQSNVVGSFVDSALFLPLAFGVFPWTVMFSMFCAKIAGGFCWSLLIRTLPGNEWQLRNTALYGKAAAGARSRA